MKQGHFPVQMKTPTQGLINERSLFLFRSIAFVVILGFTIYKLVREKGEFFYFLTNWNWIFLIIYFGIACVQSNTLANGSTVTKLDKVHRIAFSLIQSISWFVTITYWALIASDVFNSPLNDLELKIQSAFAHSANLLFPLLDLLLSRVQLAWKDAIYPVSGAVIYQVTVVAWKSLARRFWPYRFVATINGGQDRLNWAAIFAFMGGMIVVLLLLHAITKALIALRNLMLPKEKKSDSKAFQSQATIVEVV
jgi:hypothetical protein